MKNRMLRGRGDSLYIEKVNKITCQLELTSLREKQ